jgi:hypothetical protein
VRVAAIPESLVGDLLPKEKELGNQQIAISRYHSGVQKNQPHRAGVSLELSNPFDSAVESALSIFPLILR